MTYADRAAAGAALLDKQRPGWWLSIDGERLDMGQCNLCVLGQVYGDFIEGFTRLNLNALDGEDGKLLRDCVDLGFDIEGEIGFTELADAWRVEIGKRSEALV